MRIFGVVAVVAVMVVGSSCSQVSDAVSDVPGVSCISGVELADGADVDQTELADCLTEASGDVFIAAATAADPEVAECVRETVDVATAVDGWEPLVSDPDKSIPAFIDACHSVLDPAVSLKVDDPTVVAVVAALDQIAASDAAQLFVLNSNVDGDPTQELCAATNVAELVAAHGVAAVSAASKFGALTELVAAVDAAFVDCGLLPPR